MATRYPVSDLVAQVTRYGGGRTLGNLPDNWDLSRHGFPSDWVRDPASDLVMSPAKFNELAAERRAHAEERRRGQLANARQAVKEIETEERTKRSALKALVVELAGADLDDAGLVIRLCNQAVDMTRSLASTRASLGGQRVAIKELVEGGKTAQEIRA